MESTVFTAASGQLWGLETCNVPGREGGKVLTPSRVGPMRFVGELET